MSSTKKIFYTFTILIIIIFIPILMINNYIASTFTHYIYSLKKSPSLKTAIVLGAAVWQNKYLSHILQDRVDTAIEMYKIGKIKCILMTGASDGMNYNEVYNMKKYAVNRGIPSKNIIMDNAGFTTYQSMYRAKKIFNIDSAIVITQYFHMKRALYIANKMNIKACGVPADKRTYNKINYYIFREYFARIKAWLQVELFKPEY